jgi:hypothetical protein
MKRLSTLTPLSLAGLLALAAAACSDHTQPLAPDGAEPLAEVGVASVVQVAPPTGIHTTDRASIMAALEQVRAGGTVQFQPGTYRIGDPADWELISVTVPRVTLQGHPGGTTLQGCEPAEINWDGCYGVLLLGERQTVRNLTFTYYTLALAILPFDLTVGGYRVEGSTFQNSYLGIFARGNWPQPAVIGNNRFINVGSPLRLGGRTYHMLDNEITVPQPQLVPLASRLWDAVFAYALPGPCDNNVFARNRIEGYIDGIGLVTDEQSCNHNVIRDNTIRASGALDLPGWHAAALYLDNWTGDDSLMKHNLIQGNQVLGAEGAAIQLIWVTGNRVVNNTIAQVTPDEGFADGIHEYYGDGNQLLANTFGDVPGYSARLWGNHNHVATTTPSETVWIWDQAVGNRVTGPGSAVVGTFSAGMGTEAAPAAAPAIPERAALRMMRQREGAEAVLERLAPPVQQAAPR